MEEYEITELDPETEFGTIEKTEYVPAPVNQPLAAHIAKINKTEQRNVFKTLPNGDPNPDYDKLQDVFIFCFSLDESDAKGQVYNAWVSPKKSEKSKLGKIAAAVFGSWEAISGKKAKDFLGQPLQVTLKPSSKNPDRLIVDTDKLFPPKPTQKQEADDVAELEAELEASEALEAIE